ncbi:MAG: PilZ domain-containing protein [Candidatus Dadabacteria bacterium]|nr:MAG: PilZ domain-containing protein [Candidatus Dadabacteria bacterium]
MRIGGSAPVEAVCLDVAADRVVLAPLASPPPPVAPGGEPAEFRVPGPGGVLRVAGRLAPGAGDRWVLRIEEGGVERINRRSAYRLGCTLKAEWAAPGEAGPRPCVVLDLSVGGARLSAAPPLPSPGTDLQLWIRLGPEEILGPVPALVLEARPDPRTAPFPGRVRLRFAPLPARVEGRIARFIVQGQRELLQKGLRP